MNSHPRSHLQQPSSITSLSPLTGTLKRTVTARLSREFGDMLPEPLLRRVVKEAECVAHESGFPNLFFPALADEKVRLVAAALSDSPFARPRQLHAAA
jgi:hypothetical protein